jgi:hypothetical protein
VNSSAQFFPASQLQKAELRATDGVVGRVDDLLFEAHSWRVRYLVVDTGAWLAGRRVLIAPSAVRGASADCFAAHLTRAQIHASPPVEAAAGLSRADEERLHEHYRWPPYWIAGAGGFGLGGDVLPDPATAAVPTGAIFAARESAAPPAAASTNGWRSTRHLLGRIVRTGDDDSGEVDDVLVDVAHWQVRFLEIDAKRWWPGGRVRVPVDRVTDDGGASGRLLLSLTREELRRLAGEP